MRSFTLSAMAVFAAAAATSAASGAEPVTLSGPFVHENLAVYFIHGPDAAGPVPLTLSEALSAKVIDVRETGQVNSLEIENKGDAPVFVQAGDIVKGGQQDRVLMVSMVLPSHSGPVPIGSFCVEQGRWSRRGAEDSKRFASSAEALPSREAKLAMAAPAKPEQAVPPGIASPAARLRPYDDTSSRQAQVWKEVANTQSKLGSAVGGNVRAAQSDTSLQLSLENTDLRARRAAYVKALEEKAADSGVTGYVFAINGHISIGDQYDSSALFHKMWQKQLAAAATEAIGSARVPDKDAAPPPLPTVADVQSFLDGVAGGKAQERPIGAIARQVIHDGDKALFVETAPAAGRWFHRSYLAK